MYGLWNDGLGYGVVWIDIHQCVVLKGIAGGGTVVYAYAVVANRNRRVVVNDEIPGCGREEVVVERNDSILAYQCSNF